MQRTAVIIPAFNEADALPATLRELRAIRPDLHVVVVDDGSRDRTAEVARALGVDVLSLPYNLGIGGALRLGFRYVVEQGFDRALQFDADGQHDPHEIATLLAPLDQGADLVIGSRFLGRGDYKVGRSRGLAMRILRSLALRLAGRKFTDTSSGFRAFSRLMLERFALDYPVEYLDSVEALVFASRAGYDVREVPTSMRERSAGVASNRRFRLLYHYVRLLVVLSCSPRPAPRPTAPLVEPQAGTVHAEAVR
jgi:glycosyltransferase involved in cell wall biosynthesis